MWPEVRVSAKRLKELMGAEKVGHATIQRGSSRKRHVNCHVSINSNDRPLYTGDWLCYAAERERERERQVEHDIGALPRLSSVVDLLLTPAARRVAIIRACLPLSSRCPLNVHARAHAERKEMRRRRRRGRSCLAWSKPK